MSNLDLTISEIMHGDTPVVKIMKGDVQKWPYVLMYSVTTTLTNITSDAPASVVGGTSLTITLTPSTDYSITSYTVTMGGIDITSTAYNNGTIYISSVTGNVNITAVAIVSGYQYFLVNGGYQFITSDSKTLLVKI